MSISAKVVADSMSGAGIRLTTMELVYPRFIHDEVMTHRQFSRNASSQRAIPVEKMIEAVALNPAMPVRFGLNGKGMQDHGALSPFGIDVAKKDWLAARDDAVKNARAMLARKEPTHKQIINRILSPFSHITVLLSSTEWNNFWALRCHQAADPTMEELATVMKREWNDSTPTLRDHGDWHLPYIDADDIDAAVLHAFEMNEAVPIEQLALTTEELDIRATAICCRVSAARCARVSYLTHDKKRPAIAEDLELFRRLMETAPLHASPAEHQATPDRMVQFSMMAGWENQSLHGNFVGWQQYRKMFVGESVVTNATGIGSRAQIRQEAEVGKSRNCV